jgi:hypothetical protein
VDISELLSLIAGFALLILLIEGLYDKVDGFSAKSKDRF